MYSHSDLLKVVGGGVEGVGKILVVGGGVEGVGKILVTAQRPNSQFPLSIF